MMSRPRCSILDEPTSGLDPIVQQEFQALVREHTAAGRQRCCCPRTCSARWSGWPTGSGCCARAASSLSNASTFCAPSPCTMSSARFGADVSAAEFAGIPDVRDLVVERRSLTCKAPQTALDALLKRIARHPLVDFGCAEAELEETFLTYYGIGGEATAVREPVGVADAA